MSPSYRVPRAVTFEDWARESGWNQEWLRDRYMRADLGQRRPELFEWQFLPPAVEKSRQATNQTGSAMQLFEYAVTYIPKNDDGSVNTEGCKILVTPTQILARDERSVERTAVLATAAIADINQDFVQVLVRPFGRF